MNGSTQTSGLVRMEWDRAHETIEGHLWSLSDSGAVIAPMRDLVIDPGLMWIRRDEIVSVEALDALHPSVRLARLRAQGLREGNGTPNPLVLTFEDLDGLLDELADAHALILFHVRRTGSGEALVGLVRRRDGTTLLLDEILPSGRRSGDTIEVETDDLIAVVWGDHYLMALAELLNAEA